MREFDHSCWPDAVTVPRGSAGHLPHVSGPGSSPATFNRNTPAGCWLIRAENSVDFGRLESGL
jgi:hypothetical protein